MAIDYRWNVLRYRIDEVLGKYGIQRYIEEELNEDSKDLGNDIMLAIQNHIIGEK